MINKKLSVVVLAGSLRKDSFNKQVAIVAADHLDKKNVLDLTIIDLSNLTIPLYNQDIETTLGIPNDAKKVKELFNNADALIIASPEYNGSISGALKNVLDWVSRSAEKKEPMCFSFKGKFAAIISASPSALGGVRGLYHLRDILSNCGCILMPEQLCLKEVHLGIDKHKQEIEKFADKFFTFISKILLIN